MNPNQYKRLMRAFTVLWVSMLIVILVLIFLLVRPQKPPVINNYSRKGDPGQSIIGPQGSTGIQGLAGVGLQGPAGQNGAPGVTQIITNTTNVPVPGRQGEKGNDGKPGADGAQLLIRVDPVSCQLQTKYDSDDFWQALAQLPTPCTIEAQ